MKIEKHKYMNKIHDRNENVSFIKDTYLQYNRIDPNKKFENFIIGSSNKLAFEASKKVSRKHILIIILFIFMVELEWVKHIY